MLPSRLFRLIIAAWLILLAPTFPGQQPPLVAVAANFSKPMTEITAEFEKGDRPQCQVVVRLNRQIRFPN
jgi:ABC-type molybdate transport system substrate-binding protein